MVLNSMCDLEFFLNYQGALEKKPDNIVIASGAAHTLTLAILRMLAEDKDDRKGPNGPTAYEYSEFSAILNGFVNKNDHKNLGDSEHVMIF